MNAADQKRVQHWIDDENWPAARAELDAIDRSARDGRWLALRAEVESAAGDSGAAVKLYTALLERGCDDPAALYNASVAFSDAEDHLRAVQALESLVEIEGANPSVLNDLAYEYNEAGFHVPALLSANEAERLSEDEEQRCLARLNAATSLANMRRTQDARDRLDAMLNQCTGTCGERDAATELRRSLGQRSSAVRGTD